jgi:phage gp29-like protein
MSAILGPDGKPLDIRAVMRGLDQPQTAELGAIRREFDRHPAKGLTPAKLAGIMLRAEQGELVGQAELADDMEERDAHLYAELGKRRGAITALEWSIAAPENPTPEEEALTEQVRDWVGMITAHANGVDGGMEVLLGAMTAAVLPGYAPIELTWNLQADAAGRQVRVPHCTLQPQRWFTTSPDRRRFLLRSKTKQVTDPDGLAPVMGEELRPLAWLMHVHPARNGYLARMSLARVLFWPYLFKNYAVRDLAEFLEIYGLPLRLGKYPAGAGDDEKLTLLRAVTDIGHNAAGIIPQGMALEFESAAAGTEVPFAAMWDRLDAAESKAILGQTLSASEGQHGTQALGNVHNDVRMDIRAADAELYEGSFTRQIIGPLCMLNQPGVNMRRLPRLVIDTGEPEDLQVYADNLPKLVKMGMRITKQWAHEKLKIPEAEEGAEVLTEPEPLPLPGAVPGAMPGKPGQKRGAVPAAKDERAAFANLIAQALAGQVNRNGPPRDLVDELVEEQAAQWAPLLGPLVEPLLAEVDKALASGESLQAFAARLPDLIPKLEAQPITQALARAAFSARLTGEADIDL